jgi:hypothetical protein
MSNVFISGETGDIRLGYLSFGGTASYSLESAAAAVYHAPELAGSVPTPASDMYSFGVCLLHIITGERPYWTEDREDIVAMRAARASGLKPRAFEQYVIAPEVLSIIESCLQLDPSSRPTASHLLEHPWLRIKAAEPGEPAVASLAQPIRQDLATPPKPPPPAEAPAPAPAVVTDPPATVAVSKSAGTGEPEGSTSMENTPRASTDPAAPIPQPPETVVHQPAADPIKVTTNGGDGGIAARLPRAGRGNSKGKAPTPRESRGSVSKRGQEVPPPGPNRSLPLLEGVTFEAFTFKRNKINVQMSLFYKHRSPEEGAPPSPSVIKYRSVKFSVMRDDEMETPSRLASELVSWGLVHPDDEDAAEQWLSLSLAPLLNAPQAYTREMIAPPVPHKSAPPADAAPPPRRERSSSMGTPDAASLPTHVVPPPPSPQVVPPIPASVGTEAAGYPPVRP